METQLDLAPSQWLDLDSLEGFAVDEIMSDSSLGFDTITVQGTNSLELEEFQPSLNQSESADLEGIQASDVNSLLKQFEEAASRNLDSNEFHDVDNAPTESQSLPTSRVCSTTASPATTPPATPPPTMIRKICSRQNQMQKRKSAIMLPLGAPAKRSHGQATCLELSRSHGSVSKLQRILSRSNSSTNFDGPVGFQPVQPAEPQSAEILPFQPLVVSARHNAAQYLTTATSQASHPLTFSFASGTIVAKGENTASNVEATFQQHCHSNFQETNGKPTLAEIVAGGRECSFNQKQNLSVENLPHVKAKVKDLPVFNFNSNFETQEKQGGDTHKRSNIVLSKDVENICAIGLDSVLDHDYCSNSPRRVVLDEFDLMLSPTKSNSKNPLHKVKSLPIIKNTSISLSQNPDKPAMGQVSSTGGKSSGIGAVTVQNLIPKETLEDNHATCSSVHPTASVDLVSLLKQVQNLFTVENGTLKLRSPATSGSGLVAFTMSTDPQNTQQISVEKLKDAGQNVSKVSTSTTLLAQGPAVILAQAAVSASIISGSQGHNILKDRSLCPIKNVAEQQAQKPNPAERSNHDKLSLEGTSWSKHAQKGILPEPQDMSYCLSDRTGVSSTADYNTLSKQGIEPPLLQSKNEDGSSPNYSHSKQLTNAQVKKSSDSSSKDHSNEPNLQTGQHSSYFDENIEREKNGPLQEPFTPVTDRKTTSEVVPVASTQNTETTETQADMVLFSMPQFDSEELPSADVFDRIVDSVQAHSSLDVSSLAEQQLDSPSCPKTGCHETFERLSQSPATALESSPEKEPHITSSQQSPEAEAGTSPQDFCAYSDDFLEAWEKHIQEDSLNKAAESKISKSFPLSDKEKGPSSSIEIAAAKHMKVPRCRRQERTWKPGSSPVREDSCGFFSKIPTYYTALSIPTKTGRRQLTAEDASKSVNDFLPVDMSPEHGDEKEEMFDKMPSYFSCFTNSTKYDEIATTSQLGVAIENEKASELVSAFTGDTNHSKALSPGYSKPDSSSSVRSFKKSEARRSKRYRSQRSSSSSDSSRSRSRKRAKTNRRRRRRSPSLSGSSCSSSRSSRSYSRSPSRSGSCYSSSSLSRSRSRSRSRIKRYPVRYRNSRYHSSVGQDKLESNSRMQHRKERRLEKIKKMEERKIVYVGRIPDGYTRRQLYQRFEQYGKIEEVSVHFREAGDNYGFVTYYDPQDAFRAIDKGNGGSGDKEFDLCFGGRRHFCANEYADLDGNLVIEEEYAPFSSKEPVDFDELLKQAQRNLRQKR